MSLGNISNWGKLTTLVSAILGSVIFLLYYFTSSYLFIFLGYAFIVVAGLLNLSLLLVMLWMYANDKTNGHELPKTVGLMLLNIPLMLFYCYLSLILLSTMRITFVNKTGTLINHIQIVGCDDKTIPQMVPEESKTLWVKVKGDCYIDIEYEINGQKQEERVASYVTNNMGQKLQHNIDGRDKDIL